MNSELFKFAFFPRYDDAIKYLAENLAEPEDWDFGSPANKSYSILKNYLEHTFRKLSHEKKIAYTKDNKFACFNTGLMTSNLEDIYAYFEENKMPKSPTAFCFKAFLKKSDSKLLRSFSSILPEVADYFAEPKDLIFNPKMDLIPDIDHIIEDNISRFPKHLQTGDSQQVHRSLSGAIDEVKKKVRSNYKLAVPQYYNRKVQLLLPLNLTAGSPNPDLALVLNILNDSAYCARTCLTIKMAYNNARLIVKPQSDWLHP